MSLELRHHVSSFASAFRAETSEAGHEFASQVVGGLPTGETHERGRAVSSGDGGPSWPPEAEPQPLGSSHPPARGRARPLDGEGLVKKATTDAGRLLA